SQTFRTQIKEKVSGSLSYEFLKTGSLMAVRSGINKSLPKDFVELSDCRVTKLSPSLALHQVDVLSQLVEKSNTSLTAPSFSISERRKLHELEKKSDGFGTSQMILSDYFTLVSP